MRKGKPVPTGRYQVFTVGMAPQYSFFKTLSGAERFQRMVKASFHQESTLTDLGPNYATAPKPAE